MKKYEMLRAVEIHKKCHVRRSKCANISIYTDIGCDKAQTHLDTYDRKYDKDKTIYGMPIDEWPNDIGAHAHTHPEN